MINHPKRCVGSVMRLLLRSPDSSGKRLGQFAVERFELLPVELGFKIHHQSVITVE